MVKVFLLLLIVFGYHNEAQAYINPGSGSDFFQIILSGLATIGVFLKSIFDKLLGRSKKEDKDYE